MNTGVQRSGATPPAARTANTKPVGDEPGNVFGQGKNAPLIAMAHEIPYVATATVAELRDLEYKVEKAMEFRGARYLHVFVPCPLGWGSASAGHDQDRAPRQGDRHLPRLRGRGRRGRRRLEDPQTGAGHRVPEAAAPLRAPLRGPAPDRHHRGDPGSRRRQHPGASACTAATVPPDLLHEAATTCSPTPHTDRSDGSHREERCPSPSRSTSAPASPTRPAAGGPSAPSTSTAAPLQPRLPRRRELPGLALRGRGRRRRLRARLAKDRRGQPVPAIMGRVCYHPCERAATAGADEAVGIHSVERFIGDEAIKQGWSFDPPAASTGKRVLVVGAGPPASPPPTTCAASGIEVTIHEAARWPAA